MRTIEAVLEDLNTALTAVGNDLVGRRPACVNLHRDLDIETTPVDDDTRAMMRERVSQMMGMDLDELDTQDVEDLEVDYSQEHIELHGALGLITDSFMGSGRVMNPDDLVALAISVGRRYGMIEATRLLDVPGAIDGPATA